MISKRFSFPLFSAFHSCFFSSSTPSFLCKGLIYESLLKKSSEAKAMGKKGWLIKEHFISLKFFVRDRGMSGLNPPLCWRAVVGLKYDIIFPIGERRISLRGWQNAFAQCSYFMHLFLIPSSQGASCIQPPICSS